MSGRRRHRRRIAVVTGTRAEYGLLRSTIAAIRRRPQLELQLVVTGMHLLEQFGHTVDDIVADGVPILARVPMQRGDDSPTDQATGLARGVAGLAEVFERARTDLVLVLGDRIEALAGALAAVTTGRLLAHVHGGDVAPGDFDESLRHAITKLAHVHLAASRQAARRIVRMGEERRRVHVVGAPGLDRLRELMADAPAANGKPRGAGLALVVQHAHGRAAAAEQRVAESVLSAVAERGLRRLIVYPNSDRGFSGVVRAIERHCRESRSDDVVVRRSLPRDEYLQSLLRADVLVGNSSSGLIEAPFAGTPSVDVGQRQAGRQPGGPSVVRAEESGRAIRAGLGAALRKRPRAGGRSVYGDGRASERIARILAAFEPGPRSCRKRNTY